MPYTSGNKIKKDDQIDSIFPTLESALHTLHIYSFGLESTRITDFPLSARTGLASLIRQVCIAGFDITDKNISKETKEEKKIVELIEGGIPQKVN